MILKRERNDISKWNVWNFLFVIFSSFWYLSIQKVVWFGGSRRERLRDRERLFFVFVLREREREREREEKKKISPHNIYTSTQHLYIRDGFLKWRIAEFFSHLCLSVSLCSVFGAKTNEFRHTHIGGKKISKKNFKFFFF